MEDDFLVTINVYVHVKRFGIFETHGIKFYYSYENYLRTIKTKNTTFMVEIMRNYWNFQKKKCVLISFDYSYIHIIVLSILSPFIVLCG